MNKIALPVACYQHDAHLQSTEKELATHKNQTMVTRK